jgi:hypothetical protein
MRVWEIDDVRALPGEIVREQDFILRLRHLHRINGKAAIINLIFGTTALSQREDWLRRLQQHYDGQSVTIHILSQGDAFIIAPPEQEKSLQEFLQSLLAAIPAGDSANMMTTYHLPQDYTAARERANHYIEAVRAAAQLGAANPAPSQVLQGETVRGALTPWALDQIGKLLSDLDVRRYVRGQSIYRSVSNGWQRHATEYFVSVDELRRERFPRLDIRTPERLFMELCSELDHRLLQQFAEQPTSLPEGEAIGFNLAVESVLGTPFAKFTHAFPAEKRRQISFELNRGDLLLNFSATQAAIALLRQEGYGIALDALHPDLLPYLNCALFDVDNFKIRAGSDVLPQLELPQVLQALAQLPREKIIFYRCDNQAAIDIGKKLGINLFQGWHIDDVVS